MKKKNKNKHMYHSQDKVWETFREAKILNNSMDLIKQYN